MLSIDKTEIKKKELRIIHKGKYDYSQMVYTGSQKKIKIICHKHKVSNVFEQYFHHHKNGIGCQVCTKEKRNKDAIRNIPKKQRDKYDYSLSVYEGSQKKIKIICHNHETPHVFKQYFQHHKKGHGCPKCCNSNSKNSKEKALRSLKETHGSRYDYKLMDYNGSNKKIKIICHNHEVAHVFEQYFHHHKNGAGCQICTKTRPPDTSFHRKWLNEQKVITKNKNKIKKRYTEKEFIEESILVHEGKYDYSLVKYENSSKKIIIICRKHGEFRQRAGDHKARAGCPSCALNVVSEKDFFERSKKVHGDNYVYTKTIYKKVLSSVVITCRKHGDFNQLPSNHMAGKGCGKCAETIKKTTDDIIESFIERYGYKYDYSEVEYFGPTKKVSVICHKHTNPFEFKVVPNQFVKAEGCLKCLGKTVDTESFVEKAKSVHGNKYSYENSVYIDSYSKIEIVCLEHGSFWQMPSSHLAKRGCAICSNSSGINKDIPCILYYIRINKEGKEAYKIGITSRSVKERFGQDIKYIRIIKEFWYETGHEAFNQEQKIIKEFSFAKWKEGNLIESGYTEMFKYDVLNLDVQEEICHKSSS